MDMYHLGKVSFAYGCRFYIKNMLVWSLRLNGNEFFISRGILRRERLDAAYNLFFHLFFLYTHICQSVTCLEELKHHRCCFVDDGEYPVLSFVDLPHPK